MTDRPRFSRRQMMLMPLVFPMALSACKDSADVLNLSGRTMGTTYNLVALDGSGSLTADQLQLAVEQALADVDVRMSNWRADSEISRFNAHNSTEALAVSAELRDVMQAAEDVRVASLGRFDTTMGPLIELWGFGATGTGASAQPALADIAARQQQAAPLQIAGDALRKTRADTQVYLAGIGKGYGADHVGRALEALGIDNYMIEIGGDLYAKGLNPDGRPWQIGIETPNAADRSVFDVVGLSGSGSSGIGLATSGDYRNYFEVDGQRYSHLIDPTTGHPVTHTTASATVLADSAMLADAWSTALLILGREKGLEVAADHNLAVQFIERSTDVDRPGFTTYVSDRFKALTA